MALSRGGQIELMPSEGGWPVTLTSTTGDKSDLDWSPDDKQITYASRGSIWVVSADGGAPRRLTNSPAGPGDPRSAGDRAPQWSPDGRWILFQSGRRGSSSLLLVSPDGNVISFLTSGKKQAGGARWSPDSRQIAYTARDRDHFSGQLNLLKIDEASGRPSGEPVTLYTSPVDRGGGWSMHGLEWSPDGKTLAVVLQNSGWDHIYLLSADGGEPKPLTNGDGEDEDPVFSPDGKRIAFVSNRGLLESTNLWIAPARGGEARQIAKFAIPGMVSQPHWNADGTQLYFTRQSPQEASDLFAQDVRDSSSPPKALTHTTPQNFSSAQIPERVTWTSKDGKSIVGLLYQPQRAHADSKRPAVLWIHGGPEGQDVFRMDAWAQYLTQQGYVVLEPNYRGSNGYGEKFRNLNVEDSGGLEVDDVASGAQYLVDRGLADPRRLAIGGGSHGGTMVAYMVTRYPDLFAAAIELYGVVDRDLFLQRTNAPTAIRWAMKMGGYPSEKPDNYRRADVLLSIDKVKTPLLVMHGENDPQVPPVESAMFVKALNEQHKTVFYYTYPGELHGFSQPAHRLDAWQKELVFLQHYIDPHFGTSSTSTGEIAFPENSEKKTGEGTAQ